MKHIKLVAAQREYLNHLRAKRRRPNTLKNNSQALTAATKVWGDILVTSITPSHIDRLFGQNDWAPRTQNLYLGNLRQFFKWCRLHNYMAKDFDPTEMWEMTNDATHKEHLRIPVEMFAELLEAAPHPRDRMIVALGMFTFMRGSEMSLLKVKDIDMSKSTLRMYRVKTKDWDNLPISIELAEELTRWFNWYRADQGTLHPDWYLVPAKNPDLWKHHPVTHRLYKPEGIFSSVKPEAPETKPYRAVQRAMRELGMPTLGEGAHTLRRSGARAMADMLREQGHDGALIRTASILGHKSTNVTAHYVGWDYERQQRNEMIAGKRMFPTISSAPGKLILLEATNGRSGDDGV